MRPIRPEVSVAVDVLVCELLAKAPSARPPNAGSVVARLLPSVTDLPILPGVITSAAAPNPSQPVCDASGAHFIPLKTVSLPGNSHS